MTAGDQAVLNMLMQMNNSLMAILLLLQKMNANGINVKTQESHAP